MLIVFSSCEKANDPIKESIFSEIPNTASIGDTITIKGENFPIEVENFKILFNGNDSKIISLKSDEIQLKVPVLKTKESTVTVKVNNQIVQSFLFELGDVSLTKVSDKVKLGELCVLFGKNFQFLSSPLLVINNVEVKPKTIDENGMSFILPDILYPDRKVKIAVKDEALSNELGYETKITDKWVRVAYSPFVKRDLFSAFVFKGEGYVLGNNQEGAKKINYFYKLNPDTYKYQLDTVPQQTTSAFATPNHVYYVLNYTDIIEYNFVDKSNTYITKCPDNLKNQFSYFTIGEDIYCLQEYYFFGTIDPSASLFLKFDYQSKTWQNKTAPFIALRAFSSFSGTVKNDIYFLTNNTTLVKYNSLTNSWTADLEKPVLNGSKIYLNAVYSNSSSVYALYNIDDLEYMYEYGTNTGKWKNLGAIISTPTYNFFGFFVGDKHFIGGFKHDTLSSDLFESDAGHIYLY